MKKVVTALLIVGACGGTANRFGLVEPQVENPAGRHGRGGKLKSAASIAALLDSMHRALFRSQFGQMEAQQVHQAFTYAFNLGGKRQLKQGKGSCGNASSLLANAVKILNSG